MRDDDPRVRRTRERALRAARELLIAAGVEAVTHLSVAERSGVGRATLYRHWPDRTELLVDTMSYLVTRGPDPSITEPAQRVLERLRLLRDDMAGDAALAIVTLVAQSQHSDAFHELRRRVIGPRIHELAKDFDAAGHPRPRLAAEACVGALFARRFFLEVETDDDTLEAIVQLHAPDHVRTAVSRSRIVDIS